MHEKQHFCMPFEEKYVRCLVFRHLNDTIRIGDKYTDSNDLLDKWAEVVI